MFSWIPWNSMSQYQTESHGIEFLWNSIEFHGIPCPNTRQNSMENFPSNSTEFHEIPWGYFTREGFKNVLAPDFCAATIMSVPIWMFLKPRDTSHNKRFQFSMKTNILPQVVVYNCRPGFCCSWVNLASNSNPWCNSIGRPLTS